METTFQKIRRIGNTSLLLLGSYILMGLVIIFHLKSLPPQIPLYYSRPTGEEQVADTLYLIIIPILTFIIVFANSLIWKRYFSENNFVKHILYYVNAAVIIIFTIVFLRIVLLVT